MQTILSKAKDCKYPQLNTLFNPNEVLLFDIETTGFTAKSTTLYLIGCSYYQDNNWTIKQWFNEDGISEKEILEEFLSFMKNFKFLLHFNGDGFDLPYLSQKIDAYNLNYDFSCIESVDIYKQIRSFKKYLHLDNLKQKTVEHFLGIQRLDKYTGGELIKVYQHYIGIPDEEKKQLLLQHNYEDLKGLINCCSLLSYVRMKEGYFQVKDISLRNNKLLFSLKLDYSLPKRISSSIQKITLTGYKNEATIACPIIEDELKFFLKNHKEYYYLPAEDMAVHKSVASYVDKNYREQAKKETCYLRKQGYFISQLTESVLTGYKRNYSDKESYIELTDSFLQDIHLLNEYTKHIIRLALS